MLTTPFIARRWFFNPIRSVALLILTLTWATDTRAQLEAMPPPSTALVLSADTLRRPLKEIAPLIDPSQEVQVDILDAQRKSYADNAAELYEVINTVCHVGIVSPTIAIAQECATQPAIQVKAWADFITALKKASLRKPRLTPEQAQTLSDSWHDILHSFGARMYVVSSGTDLTPVKVQELVSTTITGTPLGNPLNASFSPPCPLNATSLKKRVDTPCAQSIPLPPFSVHIQDGSIILIRLAKEKGTGFIKLWNVSPDDHSRLHETTLAVEMGKVSIVRSTPTTTPTQAATRTPTRTPSPAQKLEHGLSTEFLNPGDETTSLDPVFGVRFADADKLITAILSVQARLTEQGDGEQSDGRIRNLTTSRLTEDGILELSFSSRSGGRFTSPLRANTTLSLTVTALVRDEAGAINLLTTIEELSFRTTASDSPSEGSVTRHVFTLSGEKAPKPTPLPYNCPNEIDDDPDGDTDRDDAECANEPAYESGKSTGSSLAIRDALRRMYGRSELLYHWAQRLKRMRPNMRGI